jgi:hypothetical protein
MHQSCGADQRILNGDWSSCLLAPCPKSSVRFGTAGIKSYDAIGEPDREEDVEISFKAIPALACREASHTIAKLGHDHTRHEEACKRLPVDEASHTGRYSRLGELGDNICIE